MSGIPINLGQSVLPALDKLSIESRYLKIQLTKGSAAFNQNQSRLNTRNTADLNLLSKLHLPNDLSSVLNTPIHTPDDEKFVLLDWFLKAIKTVADTETPTPRPTPFQFSTKTTSVAHNTNLLQNAGKSFASIIDGHQDTSLSYSSEFRPLDALFFYPQKP